MDYILGTNHYLFRNISIPDSRHNSDRYLILGCLHSATLREHTQYLMQRMRFPLQPLATPTKEYQIFTDLCQVIPKTKAWEARKSTCISEDM